MRSSSDSLAQLASALAKAQIELVNPAKTITAMIDRWGSGNEGQTYRYAPLSAGLDIVRKTLCKHELAVIQTTDLDRDTAMVLLTTTLAHGSGEWISATWPVCRTADMSNPKLMGAALTYARRYGLFTLVGIAGEDDLDAPLPLIEQERPEADSAGPIAGDSRAPAASPGADSGAAVPSCSKSDSAGAASVTHPEIGEKRRSRQRRSPGTVRPLSPMQLGDPERRLALIQNADGLFRWALDILPARNRMTDERREALDAAFRTRAEHLGADDLLTVLVQAAGPDSARYSDAADLSGTDASA